MRIIAMPAFKRDPLPVLESIKVANHKDYQVIIQIDHGHEQSRVEKQCRDVIPYAWVLLAQKNHGHKYLSHLFGTIFETIGVDEVVVVEDDVLLSPDAIDLCDWFFDESKSGAFALNLFNHSRGWEPGDVVAQSHHFCPWGWAIRKSEYEKAKQTFGMRYWDAEINKVMKQNDWRTLCPLLSRSLHGGRDGWHQGQAEWDRVYGQHVRSDGSCRKYNLRMSIPEGHLGVI